MTQTIPRRAALAAALLAPAAAIAAEASPSEALTAQISAWNRGDLDGFMDYYWRSAQLRFASGGAVHRGWEATLARYRSAYPDRAAMGTLSFTETEIDPLGADSCLVFGRWRLKRASGDAGGLSSLLMRKLDGRWLIVSDHTSSG